MSMATSAEAHNRRPEPPYAELHCVSNFSFLRGASHPEELVQTAHHLGYSALALTDECSLAGVVRAHQAATECGLPLIIGSEFRCDDLHLLLLAPDHTAYSELCRLITRGRRAAPKGEYQLRREDFSQGLDHCLALWIPPRHDAAARQRALGQKLSRWFAGRLWIAVQQLLTDDDARQLARLQALGETLQLPLVATGDVHMHRRGRRALQDTVTAIRHRCRIHEAGHRLHPNGERHLRPRQRLAELYPPQLLAESVRIAGRCRFSLDELDYQYPHEVVPAGTSAAEQLRNLTVEGMRHHWPEGAAWPIRRQIVRELQLIRKLNYESYFLTVHDVVAFARGQGILCQGRGSAANSAVCFCLGITAVDPARSSLLFERFISAERNEPPDIDVDFEHQRREEVMQYIYSKYGRDRAALAATVICYRPKSAIRDVGRALGLGDEQISSLTGNLTWWDDDAELLRQLGSIGLKPEAPVVQQLIHLVRQIMGFPRHLSQHVGGFVISETPLHHLVPVENASMAERTVIQWDKDDLEALGLMKVDCLALGMLSALKRCLELLNADPRRRPAKPLTLATIPAEDPATYAMIQQADTIGVFQIESRAQQAMLPRLRPQNFYDLVVEIAIVRPGPIQGDMVHPYLRRRNNEEPVVYPGEKIRPVLERTLGIPIFQEQVMQIAMVAAGFTAGQADQLRRAMAAWKRKGGLEPFRAQLLDGMLERGYERDFAEQLFEQIKGFGDYGFPESHSASFALLAYASSWFKCHHPDVFTCALLNSQPMGFYAPAQLVRDAQQHDVPVAAVDVCHSEWESSLLPDHGLRLGLNRIKGLSEAGGRQLVAARHQAAFSSVEDLRRRASLNRRDMAALARADALKTLTGHRHQAHWEVLASRNSKHDPDHPDLTLDVSRDPEPVRLNTPSRGETLLNDYASLGLSLKHHPMELLGDALHRPRMNAAAVHTQAHGTRLYTAGLVTLRQRPSTAKGVVFVTLEDETGMINVVVWSRLVERQRQVLLGARLMGVYGTLETDGNVHHLIAERLFDHSDLLGSLQTRSRDFH